MYFPWEKKIFERKLQEMSSWLSSWEFPPRSHLVLFCSASQSIQTVYLLSVCISANSLLPVSLNVFNNSSSIATTIWLLKSGFYFLKPPHTFAKVTPSTQTDQKSYHWLNKLHMLLLVFGDISRTEYFKEKILLSFWMMLRWKQNCYIWWELIIFQISCSWVGLANKY